MDNEVVNRLIDDFRHLSPENQKLVLDVLRAIMKEQEDKNET